jgi:hypothetical protein
MKWLALIALFIAVASAIIIDQDIYEAFEKNEPADVFIHMPMYEPKIMSYKLTKVRSESRVLARKARAVHNAAFQPKMEAFLREQGFDFKTFWIVNSILVKSATPALIAKLQTFPEVVELELDKVTAYIVDPMVHEVEANSVRTQDLRAEWNVNIINAPQAWGVTRGEGITVSNIDTGILHTHVALTGSYRGTLTNGSYDHHYNWFDPRGQQTPFDNNGHGTHTMGTLAGSEASGVGVAPNSKFIAAKGCASSSCATADLLASAEWVICPTRQGGTGEDCTKGADLVSNSWGGGRGSSTYKTVIEAWLDAGSVPLFSQGNSGSLAPLLTPPVTWALSLELAPLIPTMPCLPSLPVVPVSAQWITPSKSPISPLPVKPSALPTPPPTTPMPPFPEPPWPAPLSLVSLPWSCLPMRTWDLKKSETF